MTRTVYITVQTAIVAMVSIAATAVALILSAAGGAWLAVSTAFAGFALAIAAGVSAFVDVRREQIRRKHNERHVEHLLSDIMRLTMGEAAFVEDAEVSIDARGVQYRHHPADACAGPAGCPIHRPSDHHMRTWPLVFRSDRSPLMERLCAHSVGHPDPDTLDYLRMLDPDDRGAWSTHGCDGCCTGPEVLSATPTLLDASGQGARSLAVRAALAEAEQALDVSQLVEAEDVEPIEQLDCCVHCGLSIIEGDDGRMRHVLRAPLPPRQACPPQLVAGRTLTVATPPR